jgi:hypothetical protein
VKKAYATPYDEYENTLLARKPPACQPKPAGNNLEIDTSIVALSRLRYNLKEFGSVQRLELLSI